MNTSRKGQRVRVKHDVRTFYLLLKKGQEGTIVYEFESGIARTLIECQWNGLGQSPVFEHEIEVITE